MSIGYNMRPMEMQGAFGIHQMAKLDGYVEKRRENARYWEERLGANHHLLMHKEAHGTKHVWFGYPVIVRPGAPLRRDELVDYLEAKGVETRPIMVGNIDEQAALRPFTYRKVGDLPNSRFIHRNAFFFGNHHGIEQEERELIVRLFREFEGEAAGSRT
jgi:CDP-6-deoxy-D-xylo-4-hexulose-3-dehydrase